MSKIKLFENGREVETTITNVLLTVMTNYMESRKGQDITKVFNYNSAEGLEVKMQINGVEVDFVEYVKGLEDYFDQMAVNRAHHILKERLSNITERFYRLEENIIGAFKDEFPEFKERD